MEESEIYHDWAPRTGVVRELDSQPDIEQFLAAADAKRAMRLRQAIHVLVRIMMERRGGRRTGKKGSLGVRAVRDLGALAHNTGGLAFWSFAASVMKENKGRPSDRYENAARNAKPRILGVRRRNREFSTREDSMFVGAYHLRQQRQILTNLRCSMTRSLTNLRRRKNFLEMPIKWNERPGSCTGG